MTTITHSDIAQALQAALEAAQKSGDDTIDYSMGLTMPEIAGYLGISPYMVSKRIRKAMEAGTIEYNGRQTRWSMIGERCKVPVYRVKDKDN